MALKPLKKPKAPWKPIKVPGIKNVKPKLPTAGHYGPSIYNPSGRNQAYAQPSNPWNLPTKPFDPMFGLPTPPSYAPGAGAAAIPTSFGPTGGAGLIGGDWEVQEAEAEWGANKARAAGDFQGGLRQALIDLGLSDTSKLGNLSKYIDADTVKAAIANKYSTTATNAQNAQRQRAGSNAALAARGILSSGQTTKTQEDISGAQESGNFMALRDFLAGGAAGLTGLADLDAQGARSVAAARHAAAMRAAETYPGAFAGDEQYAYPTEPGAPPVDYGGGATSGTRNTQVATQKMLRQVANQGLNKQIAQQRAVAQRKAAAAAAQKRAAAQAAARRIAAQRARRR